MRFSLSIAPPEGRLERQSRAIERPDDITEVVAPCGWTSARIEAWLDWRDALPTDYPIGEFPASLSPETPFDPLLGGGPDRYARRLAAWGWALGLFDAVEDAEAFRARLFGLFARGAAAPGPSLEFGARVHPLAEDPARPQEATPLAIDSVAFARVISRPGVLDRPQLRAVSDAVARCEGDEAACADPAVNLALARAILEARAVGETDADISDAVTLARAGIGVAAGLAEPRIAVGERAAAIEADE
ncbi:MAG TPA: hypothetical protein VGF33_09785, partial [Caulobacteraceae bacterium]